MTTPEQQAREMLAALELPFMAEAFSASRLAPLANLIAENTALKAELAAIKGAGEPVAWLKEWSAQSSSFAGYMVHTPRGRCVDLNQDIPKGLVDVQVTALYTRPCVPLTDGKIEEIGKSILDHGLHKWEGLQPWVYQFVRATEAAHNIKGAKP